MKNISYLLLLLFIHKKKPGIFNKKNLFWKEIFRNLMALKSYSF